MNLPRINTNQLLGVAVVVAIVWLVSWIGCFDSSRDRRTLRQRIDDNDAKAIQDFADRGGNISYGGWFRDTPLVYAMEQGRAKAYVALLEAGADVNAIGGWHRALPTLAAENHNSFWLEKAIAYGMNPNHDNHGRQLARETPLAYAIAARSPRNVGLLIEAGANLDYAISDVEVPLVQAVCCARFDIVLQLLEHGADYLAPRKGAMSFAFAMHDRTPKDYEVFQQDKHLQAVIDWLAERGAIVETIYQDGDYYYFGKPQPRPEEDQAKQAAEIR